MKNLLKVFLVDDEPLALKRLAKLLLRTEKVEIVGESQKPLDALKKIPTLDLDALFLDIQMPELNGFELLQKLENYPPVIFTTAFDEFALDAFEVYSIDYLLKPIAYKRLEKSIEKLEKIIKEKNEDSTENIRTLLESLSPKTPLLRLPSRIGRKVQILNVNDVIFFFAQEKMTFAHTLEEKNLPINHSLIELEQRLERDVFFRVNRNLIINVNFIEDVRFGNRVTIHLKDAKKTEVLVAHERVKNLRDFLGM